MENNNVVKSGENFAMNPFIPPSKEELKALIVGKSSEPVIPPTIILLLPSIVTENPLSVPPDPEK